MKATFNINRFGKLFKRDLFTGKKRALIVTGAVYAILFLIINLMSIDNKGAGRDVSEFLEVWYPLLLMFGGCIFTSTLFSDLNNDKDGMLYLTLPASTEEKFASKWLQSTIVIWLWVTATYWVFQTLLRVIMPIVWGYDVAGFNPMGGPVQVNYIITCVYFGVSAIFFLGSIGFTKFEFFKTILVVFLFTIAWSLLSAGFMRLLASDFFQPGSFQPVNGIESSYVGPSDAVVDFLENYGIGTLRFFGQLVIPCILWAAAYFKLKEKEL